MRLRVVKTPAIEESITYGRASGFSACRFSSGNRGGVTPCNIVTSPCQVAGGPASPISLASYCGRSTVAGCTKRRLPRDFMNSPPTPGGGHENSAVVNPTVYFAALNAFLSQYDLKPQAAWRSDAEATLGSIWPICSSVAGYVAFKQVPAGSKGCPPRRALDP